MKQAGITFLLSLGLSTLLGESAPAASRERALDNGWDDKWFTYEPSTALVLEQSTPTRAQVDYTTRPPRISNVSPEPTSRPAKPRTVEGVDVVHLKFRSATGEIVPMLLCTPAGRAGPFPVVVAVHGVRSNKAQVCAQVAPALAKHGFAVLAPDMALHGERPGDPGSILDLSDPVRSFNLYRQAVTDVRQVIDVAQSLPQLDADSVVLAGYSMGCWIHAVVGAADERVAAMVLMVGGAHDVPRLALSIPQVAAVQPHLAIAHFSRPLLMLNARHDTVVTPDMGRRLFAAAAAAQPKEQRWYDSGHLLPQSAYDDAADWIARQFAQSGDR